MRRCVITGGARICNYSAVRTYLREDDYYIFCDSGMKHQEPLGVIPDLIVGDFDSWNREDLPEAEPGRLNVELNFREVKQSDIENTPLSDLTKTTAARSVEKLEEDRTNPQKPGHFDDYPDTMASDRMHAEVRLLPHDKYDIDTAYGVREGIARGFDEFLLIGVTGQRMDHTLSNLYLLEMLDNAGKHGLIVDDYSDMELVSREPSFVEDRYIGFSLVNITGIARGIRVENARYCYFPGDEITSAYQYAISNEVLPGQTARITVAEGKLLLIRNRQDS